MGRNADPLKVARAKRLLKQGWTRTKVQKTTGLHRETVLRVQESLTKQRPPEK